ncbi:all trans-polyprenyl-diphosphate synthase PDSS2-like [Dreissena polymorpha]|uniref:Decaprenyl-diphosphate synthase subunit 2 n=1 Tax=Dreissena polymorpha TaxID=45954 RepID=A0A9D4CZH4_DREPO|nr:all trans-polyprenyl-diphosphate synthase PDSS2-like [Dreissena polymorpha]KAH3736348.1 hypothetical protein DPMN_042911 [Dreissena polymorpha]
MQVRKTFIGISRLLSYIRVAHTQNARCFVSWNQPKTSDWKKAVSEAEKIVGYPTSFMSLRCLLSDELANVALQVRKLVGTKHPLLKTARGFLDNGKHSLQTRGLMILLISKAAGAKSENMENVDHSADEMVSGIYPSQRQLAEITEMINTANLVHRGVVNLDTLKDTDGSLKDMEFGNKIAVLSGDFLLTSASTGLAELRNTKVVELVSMAIGDMMSAEFTSLRDRNGQGVLPEGVTFSCWERQTFLQSGSLLSRGCRSAMELAGHNEQVQMAAEEFGKNIAYARQMNEDLLPFANLGVDPNGILSSAPVIRYAEVHGPQSIDTFSGHEKIIATIIRDNETIEWCKEKCRDYGRKAITALDSFEPSEAKSALVNIVQATTAFKPVKS